jgi:hypothetical protein
MTAVGAALARSIVLVFMMGLPAIQLAPAQQQTALKTSTETVQEKAQEGRMTVRKRYSAFPSCRW